MDLHYRACTTSGELVQGTLSAATAGEAVAGLHRQGLFVLDLAEVGKARRPRFRFLGHLPEEHRLPLKALIIFLRQLSSLFRAGLPLVSCLNILEQESVYPALRRACRRLREAVTRGESLSAAIKAQGRCFPPLLAHMTKAAEAAGNLDEVYARLATSYAQEVRLREKLWSAAAYPLFVLFVAAIVSTLMIKLVLPQFITLFTDTQVSLPAATRYLLALSSTQKGPVVLLAAIGLGTTLAVFSATPRGAQLRDRFLLRLPLVGPLFTRVHLARLCHSLSLCLASGIALAPALEVLREVALNRALVAELGQVQQGLQSGSGLADLLASRTVFPSLLVQMVRVGEQAGNLEFMLSQVADFYEEEVEHSLAVLTAVAEPALILLVGGVVGFVVVALMLPLLTMTGSVI